MRAAVRTLLAVFLTATGLVALSGPAAQALAGAQLQVNKQTEGVYDFCLSYQDVEVKRDSLKRAIEQGLPLASYNKIRPKTRCYRNSIKFIPKRSEPSLNGPDYYYEQDSQGPYRCPKGMPRGAQCSIKTGDVRYIEATIIYSGNSFPIFVRLVDEQLVGADGQTVSQAQ